MLNTNTSSKGIQHEDDLCPAVNAPAPYAFFKTIQALDTRLFDAYNRCDLGGLMLARQSTVDAVKKKI